MTTYTKEIQSTTTYTKEDQTSSTANLKAGMLIGMLGLTYSQNFKDYSWKIESLKQTNYNLY